jgi:hypothetical protein
MGLVSHMVPLKDLTDSQIDEMFGLMERYYLNVSREEFMQDLENKDRVIILESQGVLKGFSTQLFFRHPIGDRNVNVVYSGDTIIEKERWGSMALPLAFGKLLLSLKEEDPDTDLYWLLTTKGYKTYKFLPVFFFEYSPCCEKQTPPFERELIVSLCRRLFPHRFNEAALILRAEKNGQVLRNDIAPITEARRGDKHIAFFEKLNPGHQQGDELACIVHFHRNNIKPFMLRQLGPS